MNKEQQSQLVTIAIAISALLVTAAAITVPIMAGITQGKETYLNDLYWLFGLGSVVTASLLVDWLLDSMELSYKQRFALMGHGYFAFALLMSLLSYAITFQFYLQEGGVKSSFTPYFFFFLSSGAVFAKVMTLDNDDIALYSMLISIGLSYCIIKFPAFWL
ncbi:TPA: hypothetical protein NJ057_004787 [Vibrio parahaemolyticus]|uniref:hypothetical protein n=1 Tax=Vibrio diabolicus TaxID=50719 RepID=UPI00374FDD7D|nr:hypothetical protein [Vibrio parahaemolyticus]HCG9001524.1 hypothetical protein [Vibrio parahaemolyticus]